MTMKPRALYYPLFAWMAITGGRFLAPFLEHEASMKDKNIGFILSIQYAILSLGAPIYGKIADAKERKYPHYGRGYVLILGIVFGTIAFSLHGLENVFSHVQLFHSLHFHYFVQILYALNFAIMFPVLDGMTLDFLQQRHGDSMDYGKERLHGAISWGVTNLILGPLIDIFGFSVYYPCALFAAVYSVGTILVYSRAQANDVSPFTTPSITITDDSRAEQKEVPSNWTLVCTIFGSVYGASFLLCYFLMTTGFSVVENLVFLFFEFLGGSNTICAITVVFTVVFEVPLFQIAPSLLRKHGVGWLLMLASVTFLIRIVGYTLIPEGYTWLVLLLEPLHGFTYAGSQTAAVEFVNRNMPEGAEASGQGIVNLFRGSGNVLGLWLGGLLQDTYGPRVMYRVFAVAVTVGMSVFATVRVTHPKEEEGYRQLAEATTTINV